MRKQYQNSLKVLLVLIFILTSATISFANVTIISHVPAWELNETSVYKYTKTVTKNEEVVRTSTATLTLELIEILEDGYMFSCTETNQEISSAGADMLNDSLAKLSEGVVLKYRTDDMGAFTEMANIAELKEYLNQSMQLFEKTLKSDEERKSFQQILSALLATDEQIATAFSKEFTILHSAYLLWYEYEQDILYSGDITIPNPWGSEPFVGTVEIVATKDSNGVNIIEVQQFIDREGSAETLKQFVKQLLGGSLPDETLDAYINQIEITDYLVYTFADDSNWPTEIYYERITNIMGQSRVDGYLFELVQ